MPIPNWSEVGLKKPGFIWGNTVYRISVHDLGNHIGWADGALIDTILGAVKLTEADRLTVGKIRPQGEVA